LFDEKERRRGGGGTHKGERKNSMHSPQK